MEYRHPGSPSVKKFKTLMSDYLLGCKWCALHGIADGEFRQVLCDITITQAMHEHNQTEKSIILLHPDNARPHCTKQTQTNVGRLKFTVVPQSPYSPDLSPPDFW
ncbi:hypothetical protein TNCV_1461841 [Trichonephila clavipes]|nr:hypothetical protein TNCV_1461841 [Trichonephila clavipes]